MGTCVTTPHWVVVGEAANLIGLQRHMGSAGSQWAGVRDVAVAGKGAGDPHAGSAMDRAGATDSHGGGEGVGARGIAYGAISRSG